MANLQKSTAGQEVREKKNHFSGPVWPMYDSYIRRFFPHKLFKSHLSRWHTGLTTGVLTPHLSLHLQKNKEMPAPFGVHPPQWNCQRRRFMPAHRCKPNRMTTFVKLILFPLTPGSNTAPLKLFNQLPLNHRLHLCVSALKWPWTHRQTDVLWTDKYHWFCWWIAWHARWRG